MHEPALIVLANLIAATLGAFVCMCRAKALSPESKPVIRAQYVGWFLYFGVSGFSFAWGYPATLIQLILTAWVLAHLAMGFAAWRHGPPPHTYKPLPADDRRYNGTLGDRFMRVQ